MYGDKYKQTSSAYDIKGEEKTSRTSEKKEKARDGYVRIYECGNFNHDTKELCEINQDLQNYIDSCYRESERRASYSEKSTAHFNNVANITGDRDSITPQKKKNGGEGAFQEDFQ